MSETPKAAGTTVLRPTAPGDLEFVLGAEHDPDNGRYVLRWSRERHAAALTDSDLVHRIIERISDRAPVGFVLLAGVVNPHHSIELRRVVVTEKGAGYGRATVRAVKRLAFTELGAHRLWLDVMEHNTRARSLYQSEGFVEEGLLRESLKVGEGYASLFVMSVLAREYRET